MLPWVLVIHPGALGDVLLAVPALRRLKTTYGQHRLVLACQAAVGRFLQECEVVEEWIAFESDVVRTLIWGDRSRMVTERLPCLERCKLAVAWMNDHGGAIKSSLQEWGISRVIVKSPFDPTVMAVHQADRFCEIIGEPGSGIEAVPLSLPPSTQQKAQQLLAEFGIASHDPILVIHPGSGSRTKCLQPPVMASVIQQLVNDRWQVVLLEGPADWEHVQAILNMTTISLPVVRHADLMMVASVLTHAQMYIGYDSGITHLAALVGTPTLALFGPTDPARWAPRGASVSILCGPPCQCTSWETVLSCTQRVCLNIAPDHIVELCRRWRSDLASSREKSPRYLVSTRPIC